MASFQASDWLGRLGLGSIRAPKGLDLSSRTGRDWVSVFRTQSLLRRLRTSQRLDAAAAPLALEAAHLGAERWPGRSARRRSHSRGTDELDKPRQRVLAVALLGPITLGRDHEHAVAGQPPPREPLQPRPHLVGQRRGTAYVEAQLHRGGKLVDILPARTGRADETLRDLVIVNRDVVVDVDHRRSRHG